MKRGLIGVLRVEKVLRFPARKSLNVCWWRVMWCACDVVLLVAMGEVGGGAFGGVFWLEVLYRFARGESGGVVNPLLFVGLCGVSLGYAWGGVGLQVLRGVGIVWVARNFVSASLPPCSLRMSDALCNVGVSWLVHIW